MNKLLKYIKHPSKIILFLMDRNFFWWLDDKNYLKLKYRLVMNSKLNLNNPKTLNEKIQWLKLHDRNPEHTILVDKYEVKEYIKEKLGEEYVIPLIGVYDKFDDIDFDKLPKQFVIKCTHNSGGVIVCKDKKNLNIKDAKKKINKCLKENYYYFGREWPYKNVKPRIIVEQYMEDESKKELKDYKLLCFNGKVKLILVCSNRLEQLKFTFFDENWKRYDFTEDNCEIDETLKKPYGFEKMKEIAEKLSQNMKFVRIDFYATDKQIYFGEFTFHPGSGYIHFEPEKWLTTFGDLIQLQ